MNKIEFTNKLYYTFVIVVLIGFLFMNGSVLIQTGQLIAIIPVTIQLTVLTLVLLRHQLTSKGIKIFSLFFIVGSGLQLVGQLINMLTDAEGNTNYDFMIRKLVMFLIGIVCLAFCDKSIKRTDENIKTIDE